MADPVGPTLGQRHERDGADAPIFTSASSHTSAARGGSSIFDDVYHGYDHGDHAHGGSQRVFSRRRGASSRSRRSDARRPGSKFCLVVLPRRVSFLRALRRAGCASHRARSRSGRSTRSRARRRGTRFLSPSRRRRADSASPAAKAPALVRRRRVRVVPLVGSFYVILLV